MEAFLFVTLRYMSKGEVMNAHPVSAVLQAEGSVGAVESLGALPIDSEISSDDENGNDGELLILSICLHQVDSSQGLLQRIELSGDTADLNGYLKSLLSEIDEQEHKRSYSFKRETSEFRVALQEFSTNGILVELNAEGLAGKLLEEECRVDKTHGQLGRKKQGKKGIVNKGSFLQFLYKSGDDSKSCYLGVKIEHQVFLDEQDFRKRSGLPETSKVYKACRVSFFDDDVENISVYDKNPKPSLYWWSGFLELEVVRNDAENTLKAANAIMKILNTKVKKMHPAEYTHLRNAAIVALKQVVQINYFDLIDNLLKNASFDDDSFNAKIPGLIADLKKAPLDKKDGFDPQFTAVPKAVPYKKRRVDLGREISITYPDDCVNLSDTIWTEEDEKGRKLVIIESDSGFRHFAKIS